MEFVAIECQMFRPFVAFDIIHVRLHIYTGETYTKYIRVIKSVVVM
jgi:hypothetical protein